MTVAVSVGVGVAVAVSADVGVRVGVELDAGVSVGTGESKPDKVPPSATSGSRASTLEKAQRSATGLTSMW